VPTRPASSRIRLIRKMLSSTRGCEESRPVAVERERGAGDTYRVNHPDTVVLDRDAAYLDAGLVRHVVGGTY